VNLPAIWDVIRVFSAMHPAYHKLSGHKKSLAELTRGKGDRGSVIRRHCLKAVKGRVVAAGHESVTPQNLGVTLCVQGEGASLATKIVPSLSDPVPPFRFSLSC